MQAVHRAVEFTDSVQGVQYKYSVAQTNGETLQSVQIAMPISAYFD